MTDSNKWLILLPIVIAGGFLYLLAPVLTPFFVAALLAYLVDPWVDKLETYKLSRGLATAIVFTALLVMIVLLLLIFIPMLERQITLFIGKLPGYFDWLQNTALPWLLAHFGLEQTNLDLSVLQQTLAKNWQRAGGLAAGVLTSLSHSGLAFLAGLVNLLLIPVVTFYLLRDWDILMERIRELLPLNIEPVVVRLARQSDEVLGAFLRGQLLVMFGLGVIYSVGLWLAGLDLALLIGMIAGLLSFVPYLGFIIGLLAAGVAAVVQYHDVVHLLPIVIVFISGQLVEGLVLSPLLIGGRIGLHPVAVIFAVLAGGQLFGFFGVLLALPAAAVIMVLLRHAHERYLSSRLYGAPPPE